jgi:hypothetical protein
VGIDCAKAPANLWVAGEMIFLWFMLDGPSKEKYWSNLERIWYEMASRFPK